MTSSAWGSGSSSPIRPGRGIRGEFRIGQHRLAEAHMFGTAFGRDGSYGCEGPAEKRGWSNPTLGRFRLHALARMPASYSFHVPLHGRPSIPFAPAAVPWPRYGGRLRRSSPSLLGRASFEVGGGQRRQQGGRGLSPRM
ncbi:unnamed protein product [Darwinula stevensoni]|uniref:Uncharacterized protein n=1 Tax=Darwinula stevensoni TaxID=69355 RepID=A0A7R8XBV4_9CRUS|nr:unnamed protein product [Darwinula stevensoni]CAG0892737.1 unnamed protein product [Darwinula stevensoni]